MNKNGNFEMALSETYAENILDGTNYTKDSPYTITGTSGDMYKILDLCAEVTPGKEYYLMAECFPEWSSSHGGASNTYGKGTIWFYANTAFDSTNMGYNKAICFHSGNWISEGIWKYTVPDNYHMIRIRINTYANGTDSVTTAFWNIRVIPADKCADDRIAAMKVLADSAHVTEIIEM